LNQILIPWDEFAFQVGKTSAVENTGSWSLRPPEKPIECQPPLVGGNRKIRFEQCWQLHDRGQRSKHAAEAEGISERPG
jgi:hypothetical protein